MREMGKTSRKRRLEKQAAERSEASERIARERKDEWAEAVASEAVHLRTGGTMGERGMEAPAEV